jgi:hypothetical protein
MINWPAVISVHGDDELIYIPSEIEWVNHPEWSAVNYDNEDILVDSRGRVYRIDDLIGGTVQPAATDQKISVTQLVTLVQRHAALNNACCIEKMGFRNIEAGMVIIASLTRE